MRDETQCCTSKLISDSKLTVADLPTARAQTRNQRQEKWLSLQGAMRTDDTRCQASRGIGPCSVRDLVQMPRTRALGEHRWPGSSRVGMRGVKA